MTKDLVRTDSSRPFLLMDKLDDELIIEELEGRMPEVLTYHFKDGAQEVWGLSKVGVDEAKGALAKSNEVIRELEIKWEDNDDEGYFIVKAGRYKFLENGTEVLLETAFGTKRQPKLHPRGTPNTFWFEQGSIKASRNACLRLIPTDVKEGVIAYAKEAKKVRQIASEESKKAPVREPKAKKRTEQPESVVVKPKPKPKGEAIDPSVADKLEIAGEKKDFRNKDTYIKRIKGICKEEQLNYQELKIMLNKHSKSCRGKIGKKFGNYSLAETPREVVEKIHDNVETWLPVARKMCVQEEEVPPEVVEDEPPKEDDDFAIDEQSLEGELFDAE